MKTILAAALLLCFVGVAAYASNPYYDKRVFPAEIEEQCDALAIRLKTAVKAYLQESSWKLQAEWRTKAAQLATILQTICED